MKIRNVAYSLLCVGALAVVTVVALGILAGTGPEPSAPSNSTTVAVEEQAVPMQRDLAPPSSAPLPPGVAIPQPEYVLAKIESQLVPETLAPAKGFAPEGIDPLNPPVFTKVLSMPRLDTTGTPGPYTTGIRRSLSSQVAGQ